MFDAALEQLGSTRRYERGEYLFHEGACADAVYLLVTGRVKVVTVADDGRSSILALRGPGELIGELGVIDGAPRSAAAVTSEPSEVVVVPIDRFTDFLRTTPGAALQLLSTVAARLRDSDRQRVEFGGGSLASRVATRLGALAADHGQRTADGTRIDVRQDELAAFVGATREAVARCLAGMRANGALRTGRGHVVILDQAKLHGLD